MKAHLVSFGSGLLFALGLGIAGMTQPSKVIGFLNFFGGWDPSLAFVMVGAIGVNTVVWRLVKGRKAPLLGGRFLVPTRRDIDARLVGGAALFGVGWGLGGFCPGPGLVSLASLQLPAVAFVVAMFAGMGLFELAERTVLAPKAAPR